MTQSLTLGCDCLGEIHYTDVTMATEQGTPWVVPNAICMHEEDFGIGWKHVDLLTSRHEVRRSRRLVISHIATVGNYEYGFFWYFYLDGNIQLEVKLTGILSTQGVRVGESTPFSSPLAPGSWPPCTSTCSALGSTSTSTAPRTGSRRWRPRWSRWGRRRRGATPSARRRRCWPRSPRPSGSPTRPPAAAGGW
ncbi:MAG: hypothetical protein R2711_17120 [Acidimicrobiales bacterium]